MTNLLPDDVPGHDWQYLGTIEGHSPGPPWPRRWKCHRCEQTYVADDRPDRDQKTQVQLLVDEQKPGGDTWSRAMTCEEYVVAKIMFA
jgi:hypothetical protein